MDLKRAIKILNDNNNSSGNSFLDYLHEQCQFNEGAFKEYCECLITIGKDKNYTQDKEIIDMIVHLQTYILCAFIHHFDTNDLYEIQNIPNNYNDYLEELNFIFRSFFNGNSICLLNTIISR